MLSKVLEVTTNERKRISNLCSEKKHTSKILKIRKCITDGNWGCKRNSVRKLVSVITDLPEEMLKEPKTEEIQDQRFLAVIDQNGDVIVNFGLKDSDGDYQYIESSDRDIDDPHYLQKDNDVLASDEDITEWFEKYYKED